MKKIVIILIIGLLVTLVTVAIFSNSTTPVKDRDKDLILTALPTKENTYYKDFQPDLLDFNEGVDASLHASEQLNVLTKERITPDALPFTYDDIWVRDVAPVVTTRLVKFKYQPEYLDTELSTHLDKTFTQWLDKNRFEYHSSPLILDGGNAVWDKKETIILTDRILSDNNDWTKDEIMSQLKQDLAVKNIIIIPTEEGDRLSHADGMVKFIGKDTLFISDFLGDSDFRKEVESIIYQTLPTISIVEMTSSYVEEGQYDEDIASAKGLYINMLETAHAVYFPQFNLPTDKEQLDFVSGYTDKKVIPIAVNDISTMGGAVNCLTWYCPKELLPE